MNYIRSIARAVLPRAMRREIYDCVHAVLLRRAADRVFLEGAIFPWLETHAVCDVLSIGVRPYTAHYPDLLRRRGMRVWTSDIDPETARWATADHVVADVCTLSPADFPVRFEAVVFNGVIGWGVDDPVMIRRAFQALHSLVAPGAVMVLGWNHDRCADPLTVGGVADLWETIPGAGGPSRRRFDDATHVYDFLRAREVAAHPNWWDPLAAFEVDEDWVEVERSRRRAAG